MSNTNTLYRTFLALCLISLAACGGGGGGGETPPPPSSSVISGTAAAGAPIIGNVTLKDSTGTLRSVAIDASGGYSVDVSDLVAPFMLRAEGVVGGHYYVVHSAATVADINGVINVTPLTDLIVANVARQIAANYFDTGDFSGLTSVEINTAEDTLQQRLQAVLTELGLDASIDLVRTAFRTDSTGLDAALDVLQVTIDTAANTATIVNVLNNAAITDDLSLNTDVDAIVASGTATGLSDWDAIRARIASFEAAFATGLPAADDPQLLAQFDQSGFLDSGDNLATFLGYITTDPETVGIQFAPISLMSLNPATTVTNGTAVINVTVNTSAGSFPFDLVMTGLYDNASGTTNWVIAGDQHIMAINAEMRSTYGFNFNNRTQIHSGIDFNFDADPAGNIDYAVVTGPGLPTSGGGADGNSTGVLLAMRPTEGGGFRVVSGPYIGPDTTLHPRAINHWSVYTWNDAEIAALPASNLQYIVTLYDDNGTPLNLTDDVDLAAYPFTLLKPPLPAGSLSSASFPVITGPTVSELLSVGATGGPLTVTWMLPAGLAAESIEALRFYSNGNVDGGSFDIAPTDTSVTSQITPPTGIVTGGLITVVAADFYNINYSYRIWMP